MKSSIFNKITGKCNFETYEHLQLVLLVILAFVTKIVVILQLHRIS